MSQILAPPIEKAVAGRAFGRIFVSREFSVFAALAVLIIVTATVSYPLRQANQAPAKRRAGHLQGAAVFVMGAE